MGLEIERHGAGEAPVAIERQVLRLPPGARGSAAGAVQAVEESVGERGIAPGERIPFGRVDRLQAIEDVQ
jgi:hypothetical protein